MNDVHHQPLSLCPPDMELRMIAAPLGQPMNEQRIAVERKDIATYAARHGEPEHSILQRALAAAAELGIKQGAALPSAMITTAYR